MTTQITIPRALLEQLVVALEPFVLANSSEETMTLVVRTADITKARNALTAGRAALEGAARDTTQSDAELWRAYKARKDAVINAGMGKNVIRTGPMEWSKSE